MKISENAGRLVSLLLVTLLLISPTASIAQRRGAKPAPPPTPTAQPTPPRENEIKFDELLGADSYAIYAEVRMIGQQVRSGRINEMLEPLVLLGSAPKEFTKLVEFLNVQADALMDARMLLAGMPAKRTLPQMLVAVELPSVESAQKFTPKLQTFLASVALTAAAPTESRAVKRGASQRPSRTRKPATQSFPLKRSGRLLVTAQSPFTFEALRPDPNKLLSDELNFQRARSRFASETFFLYFNVGLMERVTRLEREKISESKAASNSRPNFPMPGEPIEVGISIEPSQMPTVTVAPPDQTTTTSSDAQRQPSPELPAVAEEPPRDESDPAAAPPQADLITAEERPQTTEQGAQLGANPAASLLPMLLGAGFGAYPNWPEAAAVAATLEGDALVVRALLVAAPDSKVSAVPFLPLLIHGPAFAPEAASVMPADTEIFISASLDLPQIYNWFLGVATGNQMRDAAIAERAGKGKAEHEPEGAKLEAQVAAFEKLFGFKIKEDLLASLGNEIAVGLPAQWFSGGPISLPQTPARSPASGPVLLISLNDKEKVQEILPRALVAFGFRGLTDQGQIERRGDVEITTYSGISLAFIEDFLAVALDAQSIRRVADAYSNNRTLASTDDFRKSVSWQPRQMLAQVYVSSALMKTVLAEARKSTALLDDEARALLARFDFEPEAITHAVSSDGSDLLHELHLPKNVLMQMMAQATISAKQAPLIANEARAMIALRTINDAQAAYKDTKGRGSFTTLEELISEGLVPKSVVEVDGYKLQFTATGERFEVTATPNEYGKTGRRSFYINESGVLRGGDHGGRPATGSDEPLN